MSLYALYGFLILVSIPVMLPYLGLFVMAFSSDAPHILWRAIAVIAGAALVIWIIAAAGRSPFLTWMGIGATLLLAAGLLWFLVGTELHVRNFRFLWTRPWPRFPVVWTAFRNSLVVALSVTLIVGVISSMAGYYLSRFAFPLRGAMLRALLIVHAFPVITLIVPLFLMLNFVGLINSLTGVVMVLVAFELPFAIYIMKGFFDAVPWEIEMAAIVDGASRRETFVRIILPQVIPGLIAVSVFAFIRGWEEYIFVSTFIVSDTKWVMSLYLFFIGNAPAVALFYLLPPLLLFVFTQKYLLQMSFGGVRS